MSALVTLSMTSTADKRRSLSMPASHKSGTLRSSIASSNGTSIDNANNFESTSAAGSDNASSFFDESGASVTINLRAEDAQVNAELYETSPKLHIFFYHYNIFFPLEPSYVGHNSQQSH